MKNMTPSCANCKFFLADADKRLKQGVCRRFPATPINTSTNNIISYFPTMMGHGWCGEHQQKTVVNKVAPK